MSHPDLLAPPCWSLGELAAVRTRGVIYSVGFDAHLPTDVEERPEHRVAAVTGGLPDHCSLAWETAAWVLAGGRPPRQPSFLVPARATSRKEWIQQVPYPRLTAHRGPADDGEVVLHGTRVTSPLRTGIDLALWLEPSASIPLLDLLCARTEFDPIVARSRLHTAGRRAHVARARRALTVVSERARHPAGIR